jgi:pimeloyl-ACP methyl ester carboxylesterase
MHPISLWQPRPAQPHLPLFVFFPGMDGTGKLLHKQIDGLAAKFDIRCVTIASNDRTEWTGLVERSLQLIAAELAEGQELHLCGESFGACLAMQVAGRLGTKISNLVLINPASSFMRLPWLAWSSALSGLLPDMMYPTSAKILVNFLIATDRVALGASPVSGLATGLAASVSGAFGDRRYYRYSNCVDCRRTRSTVAIVVRGKNSATIITPSKNQITTL